MFASFLESAVRIHDKTSGLGAHSLSVSYSVLLFAFLMFVVVVILLALRPATRVQE